MVTQNKFTKIILIIAIVFILLVIGYLIFIKKTPPEKINQNPPQKNGNGEEMALKSKIVEDQVIASSGKGFPRFIPQPGIELIIAPYQYTWDIANQKLLESYGFLVFEHDGNGKLQRIDKVEYSYGTACFISFSEEKGGRDFNNDGTKELIIDEGCKSGSVLWIYTWINYSLKLINPVIPADDLSGVTFDSNTQFIDIDNDGTMEASLVYEKFVRLGPGPEDSRIDAYKRIYKWNGTEKPYYLWKKETVESSSP